MNKVKLTVLFIVAGAVSANAEMFSLDIESGYAILAYPANCGAFLAGGSLTLNPEGRFSVSTAFHPGGVWADYKGVHFSKKITANGYLSGSFYDPDLPIRIGGYVDGNVYAQAQWSFKNEGHFILGVGVGAFFTSFLSIDSLYKFEPYKLETPYIEPFIVNEEEFDITFPVSSVPRFILIAKIKASMIFPSSFGFVLEMGANPKYWTAGIFLTYRLLG